MGWGEEEVEGIAIAGYLHDEEVHPLAEKRPVKLAEVLDGAVS